MIYEYRVYTIFPGKMPKINERFAKVTVPLFEKHGIKVVGFWQNAIGGYSNELIYILGFEDLAHREKAMQAFGQDPEWQKARAASEVDGPLVEKITNTILRPTDYSPLR